MDGLPNIIWPMVVQCVFIGALQGGPDPSRFAYEPISVEPSTCFFVAYIQNRSLILEQGHQRVEIPLPEQKGWHKLRYSWGSSHAMIGHRQLPVRLGPTGSY